MIQDKHLSGVSAELFTAYKFSEAGYSIYFPFLTQSKDDLVVCKDGIFNKVQVKRATEITSNGEKYHQVRLGGSGRPEYVDGDFDILAVVVGEDVLLFTWEEVKGKKSMCVGIHNKGKLLNKEDTTCRLLITLKKP